MSALDRYAQEKQTALKYVWIDSAIVFLDTYRKQYDLIFLDIRMPGMDGMSAARELRSMDRTVVLAFLTSLAQYAVEGYAVEAIDYILKPITYAALELKLPRMLERCSVEEPEILVQGSGASVKLRPGEIQYVEIYDHHIQFHTLEGVVRSYGTLKEVEGVLPAGFFRINNQTVVNLRYVRQVDSEGAMVSGRQFTISRSRRKEFMSAMHSVVMRARPAEDEPAPLQKGEARMHD